MFRNFLWITPYQNRDRFLSLHPWCICIEISCFTYIVIRLDGYVPISELIFRYNWAVIREQYNKRRRTEYRIRLRFHCASACVCGRAAADVPFPLCGSMRRRAGTDTRVFHRNVSSLYPTTANILFSTQNFFSLYLLPGDDINENGFWISGGSNKAWTKYSTTRTNFINIFGQVTHIFLLIEPDIPKIQHVKEKAKPRVDLLWLSDESSLISNVIKITT